LALATNDREIQLLDLHRGREGPRFRGFAGRVNCLAFTPDGHRLITGLEDTTLLVWDTTEPKWVKTAALDAAMLARAWADLAGTGKRAFAARGLLLQSPGETVGLLKERLQPIRAADDRILRPLLEDLDSETFAARQQASARLRELGDRAGPGLREALERIPSLEPRRRIEALLARLPDPIEIPEVRRAVRAIAVLEDIGTPEARAVLKTLAGGLGAARMTQEAQKALERASRRRE
jgi:hypothetical protein